MDNFSQRELLGQSIEWLKLNQDRLVKIYATTITNQFPKNHPFFTEEISHKIGYSAIQALIARVEGEMIPSEEIKGQFLGVMQQQPMPFSEMTKSFESVEMALTDSVRLQLTQQPELRQFLVEKVEYYFQLLKANMAAAVISQQSANFKKP